LPHAGAGLRDGHVRKTPEEGGRVIGILTDVRHALRALSKARVFSAVTVLTLALGVGANAAVFAVVSGVLLRPLPWQSPEQLVRLWSNLPERQLEFFSVSLKDFADWRTENRVFQGMAAYDRQRTVVLRVAGGDPMESQAAHATHDLFPLLGVQPALGRAFTPAEDAASGEAVAVITDGLWRRALGGDVNALGRVLNIDGETYTIIGVLPASFVVPLNPSEIWTPMGPVAARQAEESRGSRFLRVYARMRPGVTFDAAVEDMQRVTAQLAAAYPETNRGWSISAVRLSEQLVSPAFRRASLVLAGVALMVLLIAAGNVTNLLLMRSVARRVEAATRMAMGAMRGRVVREWIAEGLILGLLAGVAGLLLGTWTIDLVRSLNAGSVPRIEEIRIDGRVVGFTLLLSLVCGALLMIAPALHAAAKDPSGVMRDGGRSLVNARRTRRVRGGLIVGQMALTLLLLVGAGLLLQSFLRLRSVPLGFEPGHVMTARIPLPESRYAQPERVRAFYDELIERAAALPGVRNVSAVSSGPFGGPNSALTFRVEGSPSGPQTQSPDTDYRAVLPDYFATMGIELVRGRDFSAGDAGSNVAIVSEEMARRYWPAGNAIGSRFRLGDPDNGPWLTIIGIAANVRYQSIESENLRPMVYLRHRALPAMTLVARTDGDPARLGPAIRQVLRALDPELAPGAMSTQEDLVDSATAGDRFNLLVFGLFGGIALLLAAVGMYAVTGYSVTQRTAELGLRLALGARSADLLRMVLAEGLVLGVTGVLLGLAAAAAATGVMDTLLFQTEPTDAAAFLSVAGLLLGINLMATWIPARRATRVDPAGALRQEL